jgi:peptidoglycan/LPS O-acetylase OafA/YrhL
LLLGVVIAGQCLWAWQAYTLGQVGQHGASGPMLVLSFLAGLLFFLYRDRIIYSWTLFLLSVAACVAIQLLVPHGVYLIAIPASYVTVYLGLLTPKKLPFVFDGDYSYGLYLYGYPIQQMVASQGEWARHWYVNLAISLPVALLVAYLSWTYIEKPALALRRFFPAIEARLIGLSCGESRFNSDASALVTQVFTGVIFIAGILASILILDAHETLGIASAAAALCLTSITVRMKTRRTTGFLLTE